MSCIIASSTTGEILIKVLGDATPEANETIVLNLDQPVGATITDAQGVITIRNDD